MKMMMTRTLIMRGEDGGRWLVVVMRLYKRTRTRKGKRKSMCGRRHLRGEP